MSEGWAEAIRIIEEYLDELRDSYSDRAIRCLDGRIVGRKEMTPEFMAKYVNDFFSAPRDVQQRLFMAILNSMRIKSNKIHDLTRDFYVTHHKLMMNALETFEEFDREGIPPPWEELGLDDWLDSDIDNS